MNIKADHFFVFFFDFVIWISIDICALSFGFSLFSFCILHCHFDFYTLIFNLLINGTNVPIHYYAQDKYPGRSGSIKMFVKRQAQFTFSIFP